MTTEIKVIPINCAKEGDYVEIDKLDHVFRNIRIARISDGGVTIHGDIYTNDKWGSLGNSYVISGQTPVTVLTKEEIEKKKEQSKTPSIPRGYTEEEYKIHLLKQIEALEKGEKPPPLIKMPKVIDDDEEDEDDSDNEVLSFDYPTTEFTVQEFADLNKIPKHFAYQIIKKNKNVKFLKEKPNIHGRGRATKIYILRE